MPLTLLVKVRLLCIQRPLDEAHRFANGASRKKSLLHAFGSAQGIRRASVTDLVKVEGINQPMAERIYGFFRRPS